MRLPKTLTVHLNITLLLNIPDFEILRLQLACNFALKLLLDIIIIQAEPLLE